MNTPELSHVRREVNGTNLSLAAINALSRMMRKIGRSDFFASAIDLLRTVVRADAGGVLQFYSDRHPKFDHYQCDRKSCIGERDFQYTEEFFRSDPLYKKFQLGAADGVYHMRDYVPDDFYQSEYFLKYFQGTNIVDMIDVLWCRDADNSLLLSLERMHPSEPFSDEELFHVREVLPIVISSLERHHEILKRTWSDQGEDLVQRKIQSTLDQLGSSVLTRREKEVLTYTLCGYSAESTADRIGSTVNTVRVHRKSINRKLDVGSQTELFSLFVQCIPLCSTDELQDPLIHYHGRQVHRK